MDSPETPGRRKPDWLKVAIPHGARWKGMSELVARRGLHTVCDEAACPNKAECWGCGTATFMILGDLCTRGCRFCAVAMACEGRPVDEGEAERLALAVGELGLRYAVITSVDRDDLPDRGAGHFARCVRAIRERNPGVQIEALTPDFRGAELDAFKGAAPEVLAHNLETVRRLQGVRDARASFDLSLRTLREAKEKLGVTTKSSLLLGLGEREEEVSSAMDELRSVGCDILVMGQYLQPSAKQLPVVEYLPPDRFARYATIAREKGFKAVVSGPLARTSYHAREASGADGVAAVNAGVIEVTPAIGGEA
jgi:lipoic acid synthetase